MLRQMKKRILIIEDSTKWIEEITELIKETSYETTIFVATNITEAYLLAMENSIDLFIIDIILDVNVPGDVSGIKFADNIRKNIKYQYTPIIFISCLEDPKMYAYANIHCYGYIEKPFLKEKTLNMIEEALNFPLKKVVSKEYIYFRKEGILYGFHVNDIVYIESNAKRTLINSIHEIVEVPYRSIKSILTELDSDAFIQCNRRSIVNKKYIEYIDFPNRYIKLRGIKDTIEIGVILKSKFQKEIE